MIHFIFVKVASLNQAAAVQMAARAYGAGAKADHLRHKLDVRI
jgi:hypothetical protein